MHSDNRDITKLSREDLEREYNFAMLNFALTLKRLGGSVTLTADDLDPPGTKSRLWYSMHEDGSITCELKYEDS